MRKKTTVSGYTVTTVKAGGGGDFDGRAGWALNF